MKLMIMIQTRSGSVRFPNKYCATLKGKPLALHCYQNALSTDTPVMFVIPTGDTELIKFLRANKLPYWEGHPTDLVHRYYEAAMTWKVDSVVRLTGDCPMIDADELRKMISMFRVKQYDFLTNAHPTQRTTSDGDDIELISLRSLMMLERYAQGEQREHCTKYLYDDWDFVCKYLDMRLWEGTSKILSKHSVDTPEDLARLEHL